MYEIEMYKKLVESQEKQIEILSARIAILEGINQINELLLQEKNA